MGRHPHTRFFRCSRPSTSRGQTMAKTRTRRTFGRSTVPTSFLCVRFDAKASLTCGASTPNLAPAQPAQAIWGRRYLRCRGSHILVSSLQKGAFQFFRFSLLKTGFFEQNFLDILCCFAEFHPTKTILKREAPHEPKDVAILNLMAYYEK
jgi:hypothetical protein